jgi:ABC-type branched-subunit amino acid transport system substrate-binding protein
MMVVLSVSRCAVINPKDTVRIALLAPFEGRYREVGYNAYYAAQLALSDAGDKRVELLAVDDGGTRVSAADRAHALTHDSRVKVVIALGYMAADAQTQRAYGKLPVLVIGDWSAKPETDSIFMLTNPQIGSLINTPAQIDVTDAARLSETLVGGDVFALAQFPKLQPATDKITIVSSGQMPDTTFRQRYTVSGQFTPQPGLLATLTYDAVRIAAQASVQSDTRDAVANVNYTGINGTIQFKDGYWLEAPIYRYRYDATGQLTPKDRPVK